MNQLIPFYFEEKKVRVIKDENGDPWFVAKDVCDILGYANPWKAVEDHCKYPKLLNPNDSLGLTSSPNGITIIPESDIYRLIFRSRMPVAEKLEEWVTEEVLPSIRKKGYYAAPGYKEILDEFNFHTLKPTQKIRAMEIASRIFQLDEKGRRELFACYGMICDSVGADVRNSDSNPISFVQRDIQEYFDERLVYNGTSVVTKDELYRDYQSFCRENGNRIHSREIFFKSLYSHFKNVNQFRSRLFQKGKLVHCVIGVAIAETV